jgi:prepilin-type N-terminal cleavage/methylation domain-containing protein
MKNARLEKRAIFCSAQASRDTLLGMSGFTLVEFMVAMVVFAVIAGSTFSLFRQHAPYFTSQQNLAGTNIAMQNAVTQMQLDLANAGTGYYPGANIPSWPVGVSVINQNPTSPCNTPATYTYGPQCFDQLSILTVDPNVAPAHPTDSSGGTGTGNCSYAASNPSGGWSNSTVFYIQPYTPIGSETIAAAATRTAASFQVGQQLLLITAGNSASVNTFVITAAPVVGPNYVAFTHLASAPGPSAGAPTATNYPSAYTNSLHPQGGADANDPLGFTIVSSLQDNPPAASTKLGNQFCGQDWVMKLLPTTYQVDTSNPQDAKLDRVQGGVTSVIAEQVIGFKIGVSTWNNATASASSSCNPANDDGDSDCYHFNPADYFHDFTLVRSVRISLIGRTNPNPDPTYTFRNTFDGGPYQVVGATVIVNPRNMSMNDS